MTGHIVPLDPVAVSVVEHRQTGLVVPLLEFLNGEPNGVADLIQLALLQTLVVVRLGLLQPGNSHVKSTALA